MLIQAFNALVRIAAPSLLFKSEAIVHPDDVMSYVSPHECQISYNPLLMALLWEALATRDVKLLAHSMHTRFKLPPGCAWINYLRSHDDIGWTFDDGDAGRVGIDPPGHRRFLNSFYIGRFEGSFARGVPFQENPDTGDARVSGTLASLAAPASDPARAAELRDATEHLCAGLDATERRVMELRLEGHSTAEVARELGRPLRVLLGRFLVCCFHRGEQGVGLPPGGGLFRQQPQMAARRGSVVPGHR